MHITAHVLIIANANETIKLHTCFTNFVVIDEVCCALALLLG
jgi:hypothetical protein